MSEFSPTVRFLAAIFLVVISCFVWKWMKSGSAESENVSKPNRKTSRKKNTKKKNTKKSPNVNEDPLIEHEQRNLALNQSDNDATDEDDGLSATQILAKRRFKPKVIGGLTTNTTISSDVYKYQVNDHILAQFQEGDDWFRGRILEVRKGNLYHIQYDDGAIEYHVAHTRIKLYSEDTQEAQNEIQVSDSEVSGSGNELNTGFNERDEDTESEEEDGWHVVSSSIKHSRQRVDASLISTERLDAEGLNKRQRESRRKKQRKKELKELIRSQQQENGLHARWGGTRNKMTYVPPPSSDRIYTD